MPALLSRLVPLCVAVTPLCCVASHCLLQTAGRGRTAGDGGPTLRICNKTSSSQIISPSYICYTRGGWQAGNFVMTIQSLSDDQPQLCCHYKVAACWWRNNMLVLNHPHASPRLVSGRRGTEIQLFNTGLLSLSYSGAP